MKTLFIDTHLMDINVVILDENTIYSEKHVYGVKQNSTLLMPVIKEVCDKSEFDNILVVHGPGSFTGVRLGVTIAKTLAYTLKKPIKVISYFDVMYASSKKNTSYIISDGNGCYVKNYKNKIAPLYLNKADSKEYMENNDYIDNIDIDYFAVYEYAKNISTINPHLANPIYIKKIGVEGA